MPRTSSATSQGAASARSAPALSGRAATGTRPRRAGRRGGEHPHEAGNAHGAGNGGRTAGQGNGAASRRGPEAQSGSRADATLSAGSREAILSASRHAAGGAHLSLPLLGDVTLPSVGHLAWYAGIGALVVLDVVDWPLAAVLAVGKVLVDNRHRAAWSEFGDALEHAA